MKNIDAAQYAGFLIRLLIFNGFYTLLVSVGNEYKYKFLLIGAASLPGNALEMVLQHNNV